MKACAGCVLAHCPCVGVADFFDGIRRQANNFRVQACDTRIVLGQALADLHQRVLDVARLLVIAKILVQLLIRELASEPGIPPEKKRHQHDQPCSEEKQKTIARGHAAMRLGWLFRERRAVQGIGRRNGLS